MDKEKYAQYVNTDCWALRRNEYLKKNQSCQGCGQRSAVQIHHLTYERLGCEEDRDLVALCDACHRTFHRLPGATPRTWVLQRFEAMPNGEKKDLILKWLDNSLQPDAK